MGSPGGRRGCSSLYSESSQYRPEDPFSFIVLGRQFIKSGVS